MHMQITHPRTHTPRTHAHPHNTQGQKNTSSKKSRFFVLDGNLLIYYERENDPGSMVGVIFLERSSARSLPAKAGAEDGGFPLVLTTASSREIFLFADSEDDRNGWVTAFQRVREVGVNTAASRAISQTQPSLRLSFLTDHSGSLAGEHWQSKSTCNAPREGAGKGEGRARSQKARVFGDGDEVSTGRGGERRARSRVLTSLFGTFPSTA